jgi:hypothetical protein
MTSHDMPIIYIGYSTKNRVVILMQQHKVMVTSSVCVVTVTGIRHKPVDSFKYTETWVNVDICCNVNIALRHAHVTFSLELII